MTDRILLGVLTPSSNTALEPLTAGMLADVPGVSAHFSRFRVTRISLDNADLGQFDDEPILEAARLLADAKVNVIGWSGTSAGWLGFERDLELCRRIEAATGIPATSSILGLNRQLSGRGVRRFGLVSPYTDDVQVRIVEHYQALGIECAAESHLGISDNFAFSEVDEAALDDQVERVAAAGPDAVVPYCTNLRSAHRAAHWEAQYGVPVLDATATVVWDMLRVAGADPAAVRGWGRFFQEPV